jgi:hypothetical protein
LSRLRPQNCYIWFSPNVLISPCGRVTAGLPVRSESAWNQARLVLVFSIGRQPHTQSDGSAKEFFHRNLPTIASAMSQAAAPRWCCRAPLYIWRSTLLRLCILLLCMLRKVDCNSWLEASFRSWTRNPCIPHGRYERASTQLA